MAPSRTGALIDTLPENTLSSEEYRDHYQESRPVSLLKDCRDSPPEKS
ncbi:MAG: hypothetical protein ACYC9S_09915 [Leptospirales bacterium]